MLSRRKRNYIHDLRKRVDEARIEVKRVYAAYVNGEVSRDDYIMELESYRYECKLLQKALQE